MNAQDFLSERQRICEIYYVDDCKGCPLSNIACGGQEIDPDAVSLVVKWAKAHGRMSNFEKFQEVFPNVPVSLDRQKNLIIDIASLPYGFWAESYYKKRSEFLNEQTNK